MEEIAAAQAGKEKGNQRYEREKVRQVSEETTGAVSGPLMGVDTNVGSIQSFTDHIAHSLGVGSIWQ